MIVEVVAVLEIEAASTNLFWCQFTGNDQWQMTADRSGRVRVVFVTGEDGTLGTRTFSHPVWVVSGDSVVITVTG